ncbi:hypothetical protein [Brachybacterium sp. AOP3-A1-3]|uniref:hypothetical protein n=1 Tax=Brachybacterium sp. AOP3-A1-3 TaxID=3457699 RepID=UPI0040345727
MTDQPYTPDKEMARRHYFTGRLVQHNRVPHRLSLPEPSAAEFDRFIEAVKRDAAREALDGLIAEEEESFLRLHTKGAVMSAEACSHARFSAEAYRDTHYPKETP